MREYRIAGSHLCSAGTGGDWANGCERVALPGFDLCPWHEDISQYLELIIAQEMASAPHSRDCTVYGDDSRCDACNY